MQDKWKIGVFSLIIALVLGVFGYFYYRHQQYYFESNTGIIKGNRKSRLYHLPHCPNYNTIAPKNIITFQTIAEAESKRFQPTNNCPNNIIERRKDYENSAH